MVTKNNLEKPKAKKIKVLDDFLKAYQKQKEAQAILDSTKENLLKHLKDNDLNSTIYKHKQFTLCEKKTFDYSRKVKDMSNDTAKQKKIEELSGDAKVKSISTKGTQTCEYIRLSDVKMEACK